MAINMISNAEATPIRTVEASCRLAKSSRLVMCPP